MCRIIFASHGELSKGLKNSVSMIAGSLADSVETFSLYPGENPNDYYHILLDEISKSEEKVIILCDIKGGSVHTALSQLLQLDNVVLLSGMNMPMALDIVLQYQDGIEEKDFDNLLESSKTGITLMTKIKEEVDEDF